MLVTLHHFVADGLSAQILRNDWRSFYGSRLENRPISLQPLPIQYGDFAVWQRQQMQQDQTLHQQQVYWENQLKDIPNQLDLPFDFPHPPLQTFHGENLSFDLGKELTPAIKTFQTEHQLTTFMLLETCFAIKLHHNTHAIDIVIGCRISGRNRRETEALIGCFINNLAIRNQLQCHPGFAELVARSKQTILDAFAHQDTPLLRMADLI